MQTKFNIGDEVRSSIDSWVVQSITINCDGDNIVYHGPNGGAAVEDRLTLIRPKGCPFKVGDVVVESWYRYDSGFKIERFETQGDVLYAFGKGNNRKVCTNKLKLLVTDECPTSDNARTHIDELRSVLNEICSVLKLPGSPSYADLPKTIKTRLNHLDTAYAHCDELREVLYLSSSSSIPMIVKAVKELRYSYEQLEKVANDNRRAWRKELDGIVQALKGGTTSKNVDVLLLCANRISQIDELKKRLNEEQERSAKIKALFDYAK